MQLNKSHLDFETHCKSIIGKTLSKVEYTEIDYDVRNGQPDPKPYYETRFQYVHSIDFSIYFHTECNDLIEIFWDGQFYQYGLNININNDSNFSSFQKWDVSKNELWKGLLGAQILDLNIHWGEVYEFDGNESKELLYPQNFTLTFSGDKQIFISAAEILYKEQNMVNGCTDNLMVTNNTRMAKQINLIA